jgi:hypothetical protein
MATHRINRAEIELQVGEVALAEHLIERLSLMRERRIAPLIDRVCSELSGPERSGRPEQIVRIDQLELELGSLAVDDFEDDFMRKLEAALRAALSKRLSEQRGTEPPERAAIELLEIFARTGNLPWWVDRSEPELVTNHVRALLATAPHELTRLLRALADDAPALTRIARHCDDALLDEIVARTHAGAGAELLAGIHELERLLAGRETGPGRASAIRARSALLATLARTDTRAPEQMLCAMLHELARSWPLLWDALARGELPATPPLRDAMSRARAGVATSRREHVPGREHESVDARADADRVAGRAGARPPLDPILGQDEVQGSIGIVGAKAAALGAVGPPPRPQAEGRGRTGGTAPRQPPSSFLLLHSEHHQLGPRPPRLRRSSGNAVPAHLAGGASPEIALAGDAPSTVETSENPAPTPGAPTPALAAPPLDPREIAAARRRALDQLEQLYVDDAGLVILWPFLDRFFLHAGLLDQDRRFADEHAPMQAIALLSQLAIEDPEPPEFRLPLAKLLCGLPPEAGFALERPLAPEQLDQCERLLAAIIDHASILRDMPVASFRATFLQRSGALSVRDGAWLLQVERQAHDLVLDRFPWSWSWVKLPWMPDPLRVEW